MFEYPLVFLLLLLFALGQVYFKPKEDALLLPGPIGHGEVKRDFLFVPKWLGIVFLLIALASPVSKKEFFPKTAPAHGIMIAIDLSGSMRYPMYVGTKLDAAKSMASEFVKKRKNDVIGLVGFADFAYVASPLTYDTKAVSEIVKRFNLGTYTALRDGIFLSTRMLKKSDAKEKIIILLTDGVDKGSKIPVNVLANAIKKEKVKIYSIGIGQKDYDARFLQYISNISGGKFYQATSERALEKIYKHIDSLEKSNLEQKSIVQKYYYYQYPLFLSLMFFILFLYLKVKQGK